MNKKRLLALLVAVILMFTQVIFLVQADETNTEAPYEEVVENIPDEGIPALMDEMTSGAMQNFAFDTEYKNDENDIETEFREEQIKVLEEEQQQIHN